MCNKGLRRRQAAARALHAARAGPLLPARTWRPGWGSPSTRGRAGARGPRVGGVPGAPAPFSLHMPTLQPQPESWEKAQCCRVDARGAGTRIPCVHPVRGSHVWIPCCQPGLSRWGLELRMAICLQGKPTGLDFGLSNQTKHLAML